jgi:hypothetical protein
VQVSPLRPPLTIEVLCPNVSILVFITKQPLKLDPHQPDHIDKKLLEKFKKGQEGPRYL